MGESPIGNATGATSAALAIGSSNAADGCRDAAGANASESVCAKISESLPSGTTVQVRLGAATIVGIHCSAGSTPSWSAFDPLMTMGRIASDGSALQDAA